MQIIVYINKISHGFFALSIAKIFFETMVSLTIWNIYSFELVKDTVLSWCNLWWWRSSLFFRWSWNKILSFKNDADYTRNQEEKEAYKQMKILILNNFLISESGMNIPIYFQKVVRSQVWYNCMVWSFFCFLSVSNQKHLLHQNRYHLTYFW